MTEALRLYNSLIYLLGPKANIYCDDLRLEESEDCFTQALVGAFG